MELEYLAQIIGGHGPDVWDKEVVFSATSFMDAAAIAQGKAEEFGGYVASLEQTT